MSGVKKLTSYFKKITKDEREVEELLATQQSRILSLNGGKSYVMILRMNLHLIGRTFELNEPLYAPTLLQTPAALSAITVKIDKLNNNRVINPIYPLIAVAKTCRTVQNTITDE